MSDKPKPPPSDAPPILKEPKVDVTVTPKTRDPLDREYADKVRRNLKSDVEKAVQPREGDKSADQFSRGKDAVREAGAKVDGGKVEKISVDVGGKVGREQVGKNFEVKPTPPPEPPKKAGPTAPTPPATKPPAPTQAPVPTRQWPPPVGPVKPPSGPPPSRSKPSKKK